MDTHDIHSLAQVHIDAFPSELFTQRDTACAHQPPAEGRCRVDATREARHGLYEPQSGRAVLESKERLVGGRGGCRRRIDLHQEMVKGGKTRRGRKKRKGTHC